MKCIGCCKYILLALVGLYSFYALPEDNCRSLLTPLLHIEELKRSGKAIPGNECGNFLIPTVEYEIGIWSTYSVCIERSGTASEEELEDLREYIKMLMFGGNCKICGRGINCYRY